MKTNPRVFTRGFALLILGVWIDARSIRLSIELDDEVCVYIEGDLIACWERGDCSLEFGWVEGDPTWDFVSSQGFHVLACELLGFGFDCDDIADGGAEGGDVDFLAVDEDMAVIDHLACGPDGACDSHAADDIVETALEELHHDIARVAGL